jgi:hypothetical protein
MSRTPHPAHLRRCRSDSLGVGLNLLGQAVQHPFRDRQFVPLDLDLLKLLGQLLGEGVQFAPASSDPLLLLHPGPSRALVTCRPADGA